METLTLDMRVSLGGLELPNPVMSASGTFGYGREFGDFVDPARLGAVVVKGISLKPRPGNPPPRICETPCGMLNAIGLENVGVEAFVRDKLPWLRERGCRVVVNILGESVDDYALLAERLDGVPGIHALEVNISCPNVRQGGVAFGSDPDMAAAVTLAVRESTCLPVIVKLSPNVTDIARMARAVEDAGADAVSLINTLLGMAVDIHARRPLLANVTGGLSGPAIRPVALRMVFQAARAVSIPVIGMGGITRGEDAVEFLLAGASAVQVGTAGFTDPRALPRVIEGIAGYLRDQGERRVRDIIGTLETP